MSSREGGIYVEDTMRGWTMKGVKNHCVNVRDMLKSLLILCSNGWVFQCLYITGCSNVEFTSKLSISTPCKCIMAFKTHYQCQSLDITAWQQQHGIYDPLSIPTAGHYCMAAATWHLRPIINANVWTLLHGSSNMAFMSHYQLIKSTSYHQLLNINLSSTPQHELIINSSTLTYHQLLDINLSSTPQH